MQFPSVNTRIRSGFNHEFLGAKWSLSIYSTTDVNQFSHNHCFLSPRGREYSARTRPGSLLGVAGTRHEAQEMMAKKLHLPLEEQPGPSNAKPQAAWGGIGHLDFQWPCFFFHAPAPQEPATVTEKPATWLSRHAELGEGDPGTRGHDFGGDKGVRQSLFRGFPKNIHDATRAPEIRYGSSGLQEPPTADFGFGPRVSRASLRIDCQNCI